MREFGFDDPVRMIEQQKIILGSALERIRLCAEIVKRLQDGLDWHFVRLIGVRRGVLEAIAATGPLIWRDVLEAMAAARRPEQKFAVPT